MSSKNPGRSRGSAGLDELWQAAGGGTPEFSLAAFQRLLEAEDRPLTAPVCCRGCGKLPPHACWFAAVGAIVMTQRRRRRRTTAGSGRAQQDQLF